MPRTRSLAWSELKIGVLTIAAIVITATLIVMLTGANGYFWQRYHLKALFTNIAGLKAGSPVRLAGVEIGSVDDVSFEGAKVEVTMDVNNEYRSRITSASIAYLGSVSLLGESAVDITASTAGTPIADWGFVRVGRGPGQIADVTEQATTGLSELNRLLSGVRAGHGTLGQLVTNDRLYRNLNAFVSAARDVTAQLKAGKGTIGALMTNPHAARSLEGALRNLDQITARLDQGRGSLGRLLKDDAFAQSLTATTRNLSALTGELKAGKGTAGRLLTDAALYNRLDSLSGRLDRLIANLNAGKGTAGQLLKDQRLYENINETVSEVHDLVKDIRKDPRKYLTVRVSIF